MRKSVLGVAAFLTACSPVTPPITQERSAYDVTTRASFPHGAFLENLTASPEGEITFTSYFAKALMRFDSGNDDAPTVFAELDTHPVGIIPVGDDFVVSAHRTPFTDAPAFMSSNELLIVGRDGRVRKRIPAPDARFLNGLVALPDGDVLVADSAAGVVWRLDLDTGSLVPWQRADAYAPDASVQPFRPGVNGLKLLGGALYA